MQSSLQAALQDARRVAVDVLSGELPPNVGCAQIADIARKHNYPVELQMLDLLAHEQGGHESIGITAESCIPDIITACKELVSAQA
jgi:hypothetical protein